MATTGRPNILFVTYGGGHVAMVLPVVKYLQREGLADPVVIALTIAGAVCRREGIAALGARDLLPPDPEESAHIVRLGEELTAGMAGHPDIAHEETVAYHGLSYFDLEQRHGTSAAAEMFREKGRRAFLPISLYQRVIAELAPDVVVATNSPRSERAAIHAASLLDVPSCCILDVFGLRAEWMMEPGFADRICVLSESVRETFVANGRSSEEIVATGNPAFDALVDVRDHRLAGPQSSRFRVLWATHPEPVEHPIDGRPGNLELTSDISTALRQSAERNADWDIVVRPHPIDRDFDLEGPSNLSVIRDEPLEDRLAWADVVVTAVSTVGIQASLAGIPVVAVEGSVLADEAPYAQYGFAYAADVADLGATLERLRAAPVALDPGFADIGGAAQRVADVLLELGRR